MVVPLTKASFNLTWHALNMEPPARAATRVNATFLRFGPQRKWLRDCREAIRASDCELADCLFTPISPKDCAVIEVDSILMTLPVFAHLRLEKILQVHEGVGSREIGRLLRTR